MQAVVKNEAAEVSKDLINLTIKARKEFECFLGLMENL